MVVSDRRIRCRALLGGAGLAILLGWFVACANLVGADFDNAKPRPTNDAGSPAGDAANAANAANASDAGDLPSLSGVHSTQTAAQFGSAIAIDDRGLAIAAPFEDVPAPPGDVLGEGGLLPKGGAVYYYDLGAVTAPPRHLVAFNVAALDGFLAANVAPVGFAPSVARGGISVALGDTTLAVGVSAEGSSGEGDPFGRTAPLAGAVYAYDRAAIGSPPQYIKSPAPGTGDLFGFAVSLSGDRLAVGTPGEDRGATDSGAVYVYTRVNGKYVLEQRIQPEIARDGDYFGGAVAMDADVLVVGAWGEGGTGTGVNPDRGDASSAPGDGAAYVYRLIGGQWTQEAYLKPGEARALSFFGFSVAVSHDTIAIGTPGAISCPGDSTLTSGTTYLFTKPDAGWTVGPCLNAGPVQFEVFGYGVSLLDDLLVVGAPWDYSGNRSGPMDNSAPFAGAAFLFARDTTGAFTESAYLKAPEIRQNDVFGYAVGVTANLLAVAAPYSSGGPHDMDASTYAGAAYLFPRGDLTRAAEIAYH